MGSTAGSLTADASASALEAALSPPRDVLRVLDPRPYTAEAARLMAVHSIPLMPADMLAAAIRHGAQVHVYAKNFVGKWDGIIEGTGAVIRAYMSDELRGGP